MNVFLSVGLPICSVALVALVGIILNYKGEGRLREEMVRMEDRLVKAIGELRSDIKSLDGELRSDIKSFDAKVQTFAEKCG